MSDFLLASVKRVAVQQCLSHYVPVSYSSLEPDITDKSEIDTHAEVSLPAGGHNIFEAKKLRVSKEGMKHIPVSFNARND